MTDAAPATERIRTARPDVADEREGHNRSGQVYC